MACSDVLAAPLMVLILDYSVKVMLCTSNVLLYGPLQKKRYQKCCNLAF